MRYEDFKYITLPSRFKNIMDQYPPLVLNKSPKLKFLFELYSRLSYSFLTQLIAAEFLGPISGLVNIVNSRYEEYIYITSRLLLCNCPKQNQNWVVWYFSPVSLRLQKIKMKGNTNTMIQF